MKYSEFGVTNFDVGVFHFGGCAGEEFDHFANDGDGPFRECTC